MKLTLTIIAALVAYKLLTKDQPKASGHSNISGTGWFDRKETGCGKLVYRGRPHNQWGRWCDSGWVPA